MVFAMASPRQQNESRFPLSNRFDLRRGNRIRLKASNSARASAKIIEGIAFGR
jgi:hypothetical protein